MQIAFLVASTIFPVNRIRSEQASTSPRRQTRRRDADRSATVKLLSILDWYRILRAQQQWTVFQSIRYALWLAR